MAQQKKQGKTLGKTLPRRKKSTKSANVGSSNVVIAKERTPFMTFKFTEQTVYWAIIGGMVLALGVWVLSISQRVQAIYDEIQLLDNQDSTIIKRKM